MLEDESENIPVKKWLARLVTKTDPCKWPVRNKQIFKFQGVSEMHALHWGAAISSKDWVVANIFRYALISMVPPPASTIRSPSPLCMKCLQYFLQSNKIENQTSTASLTSPFWTQKCKLASPSVTKERRRWPTSSSEIKPAMTAATRIWLCCAPSQPFGWVRTNSVEVSRLRHRSSPLVCVSSMYVRAHWWRYRRKSAKSSITVFPRGKGGIWRATCAVDGFLGLRWSLNLHFKL